MMGREGGGRRDVGGARMGELHLEIYAQVIQRHDNMGREGGGRMGELHLEIYAQVIQRHDMMGQGDVGRGRCINQCVLIVYSVQYFVQISFMLLTKGKILLFWNLKLCTIKLY